MADDTKSTTSTPTSSTPTPTTTKPSGDILTTDTETSTQTVDSPYQGKRSTGGYVPT